MKTCNCCGEKKPNNQFINRLTGEQKTSCHTCGDFLKKSYIGYYSKKNRKNISKKEIEEYFKWRVISIKDWYKRNPEKAKSIRRKAGKKFRERNRQKYNNYQYTYQKSWNKTEKEKEKTRKFASRCCRIGTDLLVTPNKIHNDLKILYEKCIVLNNLTKEINDYTYGKMFSAIVGTKNTIKYFILRFYGCNNIKGAIKKQIEIPIEYKEYFSVKEFAKSKSTINNLKFKEV